MSSNPTDIFIEDSDGDYSVNLLEGIGQVDAHGVRYIDSQTFSRPSGLGFNGNGANVLNGTSSFTLSQATIQAGALSAVGGQQRIYVKGRKPSRNNSQSEFNPQDYEAHLAFEIVGDSMKLIQVIVKPGHYTSGSGADVLADFGGGMLPAATYGVGSFSAVGGFQDMRLHSAGRRPESLSSAAVYTPRPNVLPNVNGNSIPGPVDGYYADGQYSAISGYGSGAAPSVLRDFNDFNGHNVTLRAGAFSAVTRDQIIEYDEGDETETLDREHRYR
ncbi:hypothetical protein GYMLUDRAFT_244085 [Collybiopsis luxurians FD-317 M1]|uniref:Uncharacterized protein n=1 Tax=Collybiopsis luxurians FD-317 M1 TaxID=944289 RepID=A0A0D0CXI0_9AGAR|nr:hypothetical protein GYMLUDRAFT_244085 [Collybiopsis luxurians FD-317 M1]